MRQSLGQRSVTTERKRNEKAERARRYQKYKRTNRNTNSNSAKISVDISDSQNASESIGNDSNLSNRRSRSRVRELSGQRSVSTERKHKQTAERDRRYSERKRTICNTNSHSAEIGVDISDSENAPESIGNDSNLSNSSSRSRVRQTSGQRSVSTEDNQERNQRVRNLACQIAPQFRIKYREPESGNKVFEFERRRGERNIDNQRLLEENINILQNECYM